MQGSPNGPNPLFPLLILAGLTCSSNYFTTPVAGNTELRALMEIKSSLDPANKCLSSWAAAGEPCSGSFVGVACNEHRKVANISLQGKGLAGKLTPAVAELKCLSGLYLHYNSLQGEIPVEIANLTELTDLYLNFNNLTGAIPPEIGKMASLQVLQLSYNQLTGNMPTQMGTLKNLNFLALESNRLTGQIPSSLGNLRSLKSLHLGSNQLSGRIPYTLANSTSLELLDVKNNKLSGLIPPGLKRRNIDFQFENNSGLCGSGFPALRACTSLDSNLDLNVNSFPSGHTGNHQSAAFAMTCNETICSETPSKLPKIGLVSGLIATSFGLAVAASVAFFRQRRRKQKVADKSDTSNGDTAKEFHDRSPSSLDRCPNVWEPVGPDGRDSFDGRSLQGSIFNLEEDGSIVAVKCIGKTSCKSEEDEFLRGLGLLNSLKHENLVELKGFCRSKARGECFLIYDFAPGGNLSSYLDRDGVGVLDWKTRVSIIHGIAKGVLYLHSNQTNKPPIIHQNISVAKVLLDQNLSPLILDAGLHGLLANDVVYSALKVSAALGYMAPEYITTGRFTEKSDVYAYGVIISQLLCGKTMLPGPTRAAAEAGKLEEFMDPKLEGDFLEIEAQLLTRIALDCTNENPESRPSMALVEQELKSGMKSG
ncbi:Leucine-rich repeat protein kinase family protein [Striga hermonthica]|uniref:Leucine-rich repeat protein kinase family protein n=1 Tax=Striga hermonthica TaxID=68872 RepID=A0A9N7N141_STRHE|nr:Leucine-rich repeat protein kinase family protein [Striga hermonthica]